MRPSAAYVHNQQWAFGVDFSFASSPPRPLPPKAHRMNSARVSSSHSIFSFILPVEHVAPGLALQQAVRARRESFLSRLSFQGCLSAVVRAGPPSSSHTWEETKEVLVLFPIPTGDIPYCPGNLRCRGEGKKHPLSWGTHSEVAAV